MKTTYVDAFTRAFNEGATSMDGREDQLCKVGTDGLLAPATAGVVHGVYRGKLQAGMRACDVRLLGGGTTRVIQSEAITPGSNVMQDSAAPTKVKTAASAGYLLGVKCGITAGAAGDVIEIISQPATIIA